eukprot:893712_1
MATIKQAANTKKYKTTNEKIMAQDDMFKDMTSGKINQLCDNILTLQKDLNDNKIKLLQHSRELKKTLLKLKLVRYNGNEQIQLTKTTLNGPILKAPSIVSI